MKSSVQIRLSPKNKSLNEIFIRKLKDRLQSLILGDPLDKNTDIGAINSKNQLDIINKYIDLGKKEGARVISFNVPLLKSILISSFLVVLLIFEPYHIIS